jgi:hypothetical protein
LIPLASYSIFPEGDHLCDTRVVLPEYRQGVDKMDYLSWKSAFTSSTSEPPV